MNVQAAGYRIALLMETSNCTDDFGWSTMCIYYCIIISICLFVAGNNTNVTDIKIPAVLLSQVIASIGYCSNLRLYISEECYLITKPQPKVIS